MNRFGQSGPAAFASGRSSRGRSEESIGRASAVPPAPVRKSLRVSSSIGLHLPGQPVCVDPLRQHRQAGAVGELAPVEVQPLREEALEHGVGARIGEQALDLRREPRFGREGPVVRRRDERIVGRRAPEVVAEAAGQLVRRELDGLSVHERAAVLEAVEEIGPHQGHEDHRVHAIEAGQPLGRAQRVGDLGFRRRVAERASQEALREGAETGVVDRVGRAVSRELHGTRRARRRCGR